MYESMYKNIITRAIIIFNMFKIKKKILSVCRTAEAHTLDSIVLPDIAEN